MGKPGRLSSVLPVAVLASCTTTSWDAQYFSPKFEPDKPFALITAYVAEQRLRGLPVCPADSICMDVVYEMSLDDADLLAGSVGAQLSRVWLVQHGEMPNTSRMVFIVQKTGDGRVWSQSRGAFISDGQACFAKWAWEQHRALLESAGAVPTDDGVCVPVRG